MAQGMNPAAPHHLPPFITAPGQTDVFLVGSAIFLVVGVIALGSLYFRLHALPEQLAHGKASKLQFEVVAVLALLALFTHNSWFWVAALLLAIVPLPDVYSQIERMADLLVKMAHRPRRRPPEPHLEAGRMEVRAAQTPMAGDGHAAAQPSDNHGAVSELAPAVTASQALVDEPRPARPAGTQGPPMREKA